jgi:hypothetical protein
MGPASPRPKPVVVVGRCDPPRRRHTTGRRTCATRLPRPPIRRLAEQGVVVAMAGELHAADDVRKTHTHAHATFASPNAGPLGFVTDGTVSLRRRRDRAVLPRIPEAAALPVPILGVDARRGAAPRGGHPAGLVVAAAGGGNTPPAYLELGATAARGGRPGPAHHVAARRGGPPRLRLPRRQHDVVGGRRDLQRDARRAEGSCPRRARASVPASVRRSSPRSVPHTVAACGPSLPRRRGGARAGSGRSPAWRSMPRGRRPIRVAGARPRR